MMDKKLEAKPPISNESFQYYLREHETLREEIDAFIAQTQQMELYALISAGLIWTWLATNSDKIEENMRWVWWIPFLIAIMGAIRSLALLLMIMRLAGYIKRMEEKFCELRPDLPGWENYHQSIQRPWLGATGWIFWIVLLAILGFVGWHFGL
jgi:hypothetical protein